MIIRKLGMLILATSSVFLATAQAQDKVLTKKDEDRRDLTLLRRVTENSFVHEASLITFSIPKGWKEIRPQRLTRDIETRPSTAMGIELTDGEAGNRLVVATLLWTPMSDGAKLADLIRDKEVDKELGEEVETLRTVYGKENVTIPEMKTYNGRTVYKVSVRGGPDRGDKYYGTLYMFDTEGLDGRWLIKIRVSYPKPESGLPDDKYAETVIASYNHLPVPAKKVLPKPMETPK